MKAILHWDSRHFWEMWILGPGGKVLEFVPLSVGMANEIASANGLQIPAIPRSVVWLELSNWSR